MLVFGLWLLLAEVSLATRFSSSDIHRNLVGLVNAGWRRLHQNEQADQLMIATANYTIDPSRPQQSRFRWTSAVLNATFNKDKHKVLSATFNGIAWSSSLTAGTFDSEYGPIDWARNATYPTINVDNALDQAKDWAQQHNLTALQSVRIFECTSLSEESDIHLPQLLYAIDMTNGSRCLVGLEQGTTCA